ncbi:MAG: zinc ribbon domain-containing protein [Proteobacteria bacterium]|nr:zinc ribbon domain-containing protein [Pseudomonadota bacterium]
MPLYDYLCPACGPFDARRAVAERDVPLPCPHCAAPAVRAWLSTPHLATMPSARRAAFAVNERSAHAPQHSGSYQRLRHPAGCGCCKPGAGSRTAVSPAGAKSFPSARPWMISH